MNKDALEKRIDHIKLELSLAKAEALEAQERAQQANNKIMILKGHLDESLFYLAEQQDKKDKKDDE